MSTPLNTKRYLCDICTFLNILCNWESFRLCVCVPLVCECVFVCLSLKNCNTICKKKGNKNYKKKKKFRKKYVEKDLAIIIKKSELKQKLSHKHYCSEGHQGIENWSVTLIDQVEDLDSLRKKELYWINRLNTWAPNGLNVREVYEAYN